MPLPDPKSPFADPAWVAARPRLDLQPHRAAEWVGCASAGADRRRGARPSEGGVGVRAERRGRSWRFRFGVFLALGCGLALGGVTALAAPVAVACPNPPQPELPRSNLIIETAGGPHAFSVELARTEEQKSCGLMLRQRLGWGEGMLFHYQPPSEAWMWMANTAIPLDMIFIAPNGRIVHIVKGAVPFSREIRGTSTPVSGVLEVRAGTVDRLGIREGDIVRHAIFAVGS